MSLEKILESNRKALRKEYKQFINDCLSDGYLPKITFEEWYHVWITSGHWEDRIDEAGNYAWFMVPKEVELQITKESAIIVEKGHFDIMNMINDRVSYSQIDKFIEETFES